MKDYLKQIFYIQQRIKAKEAQILALKDKCTKITASLSECKVSGGASSNMGDSVVAIVALEETILAEINRLSIVRASIVAKIDKLAEAHPDLAVLLEYRYINCWKWERICCELGYSWRSIHRSHAQGLAMLDKINKMA